MFATLREHWRELKASPPGERFKVRYERRRTRSGGRTRKLLMLAAGAVLVMVGIVFLAIPGPGIPVLVVGAAMMAQESLPAARTLDWLELSIRRLAQRGTAIRKKG